MSDVKITRTLVAGAPAFERVKWWVKKLLNGEPVVAPEEVDAMMAADGFIPIRQAAIIAGVPVEVLRTGKDVRKGWPEGFPEGLKERYAWVVRADAERIRDVRSVTYRPSTVSAPYGQGAMGEQVAMADNQFHASSAARGAELAKPWPGDEVRDEVVTLPSRYAFGSTPKTARPAATARR